MSFRWPALDGWGEEEILFPLPFAPSLPYTGTENLRFMPGWARPGEPDHWAYVFAWRLEAAPDADEASLVRDLTTYYAGLCAAVGGESAAFDVNGYRVRLEAAGAGLRDGHEVRRFSGAADLYDAFGGGEPLTLQLRLDAWECPDAGTTVILIQAAPTAAEAIWQRLAAQSLELACH